MSNASNRRRFTGSFSSTMVLISMPLWSLFWHVKMCFFTEERNSPPPNVDWSYLKIPYISERLNHKITNIFRKEGIPVRVVHRSYTLRLALSRNGTKRICTRDNCPTSKTKLCLLRNAVYQITCNNCNQPFYSSFHPRSYKRTPQY